MLRSVLSYAAFVFTLIAKIPQMLWLKHARKTKDADQYAQKVYQFTTQWAKLLAKCTGARFHVNGLDYIPKDRAVLYVANHQSAFDIIVCMVCLPGPKGFVAKIEMLKVPLLRTWMRYMRCVFMNRKDIKQSLRVILEGIAILKEGHSMIVFPEGTRSKSSTMLDFKAGSFKLATKSKVPIVPVTIDGSYRVIEANGHKIKPADVYVTIHPPVFTEDLTPEAQAALPGTVEKTIAGGLRH